MRVSWAQVIRFALGSLLAVAGGSLLATGCSSDDQTVIGTSYADIVYTFEQQTGCGAWCYHDEAHNLAVAASETDDSGFEVFAAGQLVDGRRGGDAWDADLGFGPAYEWVGWIDGQPGVTLDLGQLRPVQRVRVGMSNTAMGGVTQPSVVRLATSLDGVDWSEDQLFALGDGSLTKIPTGRRADVALRIDERTARFVRLRFVRTGWLLLDEIAVD